MPLLFTLKRSIAYSTPFCFVLFPNNNIAFTKCSAKSDLFGVARPLIKRSSKLWPIWSINTNVDVPLVLTTSSLKKEEWSPLNKGTYYYIPYWHMYLFCKQHRNIIYFYTLNIVYTNMRFWFVIRIRVPWNI